MFTPHPDLRHDLDEGLKYQKTGILPKALELYERVEKRAVEVDDPAAVSEALRWQATVYRTRCEWDRARHCARRSGEVARVAGLDDLEAEAVMAEAAIHTSRGEHGEATALLEKALMLADSEKTRGIALQNLGGVAAQSGELGRARAFFRESYESFRRAHYAWGEAFALNNLGRAMLDAGEGRDAEIVLEKAIVAAKKVHDEELAALASLNYAESLMPTQRWPVIEDLVSAALGYFRYTENAWRQIECLRVLGDIAARKGEFTAARAMYERGLRLAHQIGARAEIGTLEAHLAMVRDRS